jgi:enoyl-CoA hydratase
MNPWGAPVRWENDRLWSVLPAEPTAPPEPTAPTPPAEATPSTGPPVPPDQEAGPVGEAVWKTVDITRDGPVIVVTIVRPERRNAVDGATATALLGAFEAFEEDDDAQVAVLTGAGGTFCAGADLKVLSQGDHRPVREDGPGPMGPTRLDLTKPVIAAVEGHAVAGGLELALWCDLRVAATDAVFGVYCRRFGVPLVDGGTVRLPRLIGQSHALDLVLTGRGVSGPEALRMGLVNRLTAPGRALQTAIDLAREIAAFPPTCMRNDRRSVLWQWGLPEPDALTLEARLGLDTIASGESLQGASLFAAGAGRHGGDVAPTASPSTAASEDVSPGATGP